MNLKYLNNKIDEINIPITTIAEKMGLSRQSLYLKLNGLREFKASEMIKICDILRLTSEEKNFIFLQIRLTKLTTKGGDDMPNDIKVGDKFNRLTVIEEMQKRKQRCKVYKCLCDCGNETPVYVTSTNLRKGYSKSCGCYHKERAREANKTHGKSHTKLYYVWQDMRKRCNNPKHHAYKDYGGRGITVCDEWNNDYVPFHEWAMNNGYKAGLSIDRVNNDKGYSPDNCRWVTMSVQCCNQRERKDMSLSNSPRARVVSMYSLKGDFLKNYSSIKEACIDNGIKGTGTGISACCRGRQKNAYGFIWKYEIF